MENLEKIMIRKVLNAGGDEVWGVAKRWEVRNVLCDGELTETLTKTLDSEYDEISECVLDLMLTLLDEDQIAYVIREILVDDEDDE